MVSAVTSFVNYSALLTSGTAPTVSSLSALLRMSKIIILQDLLPAGVFSFFSSSALTLA